jgi:[histone H3]-trimethyl-L-lysine4 demethylase
MVSVPSGATSALGPNSNNPSSRSSPAVGAGASNNASAKSNSKVNSNGYHPINPQRPLSSLTSAPLDLTSVERRGQPPGVREPQKKKKRPHDIDEAPTYYPNEEEWKDPVEYIKKIGPKASQYGICKIVPPESWNPDFAIDTEVRIPLRSILLLRDFSPIDANGAVYRNFTSGPESKSLIL